MKILEAAFKFLKDYHNV